MNNEIERAAEAGIVLGDPAHADPLDDCNPIRIARLMTLKQAVRLEATGMKHSSGRSMRKVACAELGMKATTKADDVIGALVKEIDKRLAKAKAIAAQEQQA